MFILAENGVVADAVSQVLLLDVSICRLGNFWTGESLMGAAPEKSMRANAARNTIKSAKIFNPAFGAAMLSFNDAAIRYCKSIPDEMAEEYAVVYARMLLDHARGVDVQCPLVPADLSDANRKLIEATLTKMQRKYFPPEFDRS
jgi:hypothetical protein